MAQLLRDDNDGEAVERLVAGGGRPLDPATQEHMESAFGEDFQDVRVHTGGEATASAQRLGAHAYTVGNDVVFSDGHYDPGSSGGQRVLAHELAHVVQQRSGPVDGTDTGTGVKVSDPGDRFERAAEETAERVTSGQSRGRPARRASGRRSGRAAGGGAARRRWRSRCRACGCSARRRARKRDARGGLSRLDQRSPFGRASSC